MSRAEIRPLTGLRFVAALYVFLYHMNIHYPFATGLIGNAISQGAVGMSLFFILSGYILSYQYVGREIRWREYALNRFARVYPVYILAATLTIPMLVVPAVAEEWPLARLATTALADITGTQAWFPSLFYYWNHGASWSISAEFFFYALFPFVMPLVWRSGSPWTPLAAAYCACLLPRVLFQTDSVDPFPTLYSVPIFRLPEFVFGIALFRLASRWNGKSGDMIAMAGIVSLTLFLLFNDDPGNFVSSNYLIVPALGAIIFGVSKGSGVLSKFLSAAPAQILGRASYCFYSFQPIVIFGCLRILQDAPPAHEFLVTSIALIVLVLLSIAAYSWVEEPVRRRLKDSRVTRAGSDRGRPVMIR